MTQSKKKSPEWRDFEKLVALIESHLGPRGAIIKSPDYILDKRTGEMREVDASVKYNVGSVPILVIIECRRRSHPQDVTWIEQLAAKCDDVGASVAVAVSTRGFSASAQKKAKSYGIETRVLREVSGDAIHDWARGLETIVVRGQFRLGRLSVRFINSSKELFEIHPDIKAEYAKGNVRYKFIRRLADNALIGIDDLLRDSEILSGNLVYDQLDRNITAHMPPESQLTITLSSKFPSLFDDVPVNSEPLTKLRAWKFDPKEVTIETKYGPVEIEYLEVEFHVIQRAYPSNVGRLLSYENDSKAIVYVEERQVDIGDNKSVKVVISGE